MDESALNDALADVLGEPPEDTRLERLAGDGSDRRYWRLFATHGGAQTSFVVMDLVGVKNVIASEEVTLYHDESGELPFLNIQRYLAGLGLPVPKVVYDGLRRGFLLLEDLGDDLLLFVVQRDPSRTDELYEAAVDLLADLHTKTAAAGPGECVAYRQGFEFDLLRWELRHFSEYGIEKTRAGERQIAPDDLAVIEAGYEIIARRLADRPRVFTHRDYHARNLHVTERGLVMIDFQDALLGPAVYDLASLLRDSYIDLGAERVARLAARYRERASAGGLALPDDAAFQRDFDYQCLQRNLKAAGRFGYFDIVKGNPNFLKDIPRTLGYVHTNLAKYDELRPLQGALAKYVPELA